MKNKLKKLQTETTYDVTYKGYHYTVIHQEDSEFTQEWLIQSDPDDDDGFDFIAVGEEVPEELQLEIIEFVINKM